MKITPDSWFDLIRPDEVAECWEGVLSSGGLYEALWDCVASYTAPSPEDDSVDDELIPFEQIDWTGYAPMRIELNHGGPLVHRVTAWRVPAEATDAEINAAIDWWMPATWCEHEHDCCGNYYARSAQLLGRTYEDSQHEIVFVLQTHTANV